jgi:hypothetical protein
VFTYDAETLLVPADENYELYQARFYLGDTVETGHEFEDEELTMLITLYETPMAAAVAAVRTRIAKYAKGVDKWVGDLKILASQRVKHYQALLEELTSLDSFIGTPSAGGVYVSEKEAAAANTSLVQPYFRGGMDDNTEG